MRLDPLDYSPHMIEADQGMRRMYDMLLKQKYDEAIQTSGEIIAQLRLARAAIQDIKERQR